MGDPILKSEHIQGLGFTLQHAEPLKAMDDRGLKNTFLSVTSLKITSQV